MHASNPELHERLTNEGFYEKSTAQQKAHLTRSIKRELDWAEQTLRLAEGEPDREQAQAFYRLVEASVLMSSALQEFRDEICTADLKLKKDRQTLERLYKLPSADR